MVCLILFNHVGREDAPSTFTEKMLLSRSQQARQLTRRSGTVAHLGNRGCCLHIHTGNLTMCYLVPTGPNCRKGHA